MTPLEKNIMKPRRRRSESRSDDPFSEKVIEVSRVSRTVKGGRRIRFRALVVVGDKKGKVGMGLGKANEVTEAVSKASSQARRNMVNVRIINGTIPHEIIGTHGAARVLLRPASSGTSIVAGGSVRVVAELAGITDMLAKSLGSRSKINNVSATINAFKNFSDKISDQIEAFAKKNQKATSEPAAQAENELNTVNAEKKEDKEPSQKKKSENK